MNQTIDYYNKNAQAYSDDTQGLVFTEVQDRFLDYLPEGGFILDFGCGAGRDAKYFLSKGFRVEAVDGSAEMVRLAAEYTGLPARQMLFQELDAVDCYDGIWACASILHLEITSLRDVFAQMRTALKTGGILYASFKYGDFSGERNGRFFTNMTEDSISQLLSDAGGFTTLCLWTTSDVRPGRSAEKWLNVIVKKL